MTFEELLPDENCIVVGFTVSIKYLTADGDVNMMHTDSPDLPPWEVLGMLVSHTDDVRDILREPSGGGEMR